MNVKKIRFDDVGKITLGKRPRGPQMPAESTWVIETNGWSPTEVKLNGRLIVECSLGYIGEPLEQLTSTMVHSLRNRNYALPFKFNIRMVEPQHESYFEDA